LINFLVSLYSKSLGKTGQTKTKLMSGPYAPPVNLVVESSVMSPEEQRRRRMRGEPALLNRERRGTDRQGILRPETVEEFLDLDFASRCAVAGLQLGKTKVFLRREAFDRIEAMRSDKFFGAAAMIQKTYRGKVQRDSFIRMKSASVVLQCVLRIGLARRRVARVRFTAAAIKIQSSWRRFTASLIMNEIVLARRYAATIIQRAYRIHTNRQFQPSEDDIIRAVVTIQAKHRGSIARRQMTETARLSLLSQKSPPQQMQPAFVSPVRSKVRIAPVERKITPVVSRAAALSSQVLSDLFREIQSENWAMVESILDKHPELAECPDSKTGELALHKIARHNGAWTLLIDMVLVLYPKALIHRDNMGALPIHHAAAHDNLAALEIIYSAYKDGINENDKMGRLPLHVAANYDAVDSIKFLLSKSPEGAYTMVYRPPPDSGGGLPLHIACSNHASIGVITALLAENFASAKRADENGDLPLHLLLRCGEVVDPVVVKTLLTCFAGALSRTDMHGNLPLSIAIKCQCRSAVINAILMQYPEAAGVLNGDGHSPLFLAFKHNADDRTIMGLLNHAPELATSVDRKTGLLPIQIATENEHSHFIVHNLLKRDLPIDVKEKVRAQMIPHHYSWNHIVSNTDDLYHQVVTKVLQSCTQPQVLALAHVEGPDGKIALASSTPVCKHEMRVMLRLFNTLEVVNQRPAYTNPVSDTQIFYALRYDPPTQHSGQYTILHEEKKDGNENDYLEDYDDQSHVSGMSRHSIRSTLSSRSQQTIEDKLRHIRKEKGQQVIAKLTSRSDIVERELKVRKDFHLSRHYVPAIISVHHTVQHAAYSEAMAEPGYCITMEGADTTAENLMLDMRKSGKRFPVKALKRIGISLLHMHEHGIIHGDFGTHNIGKFGSRWKLLGVGGSTPIGSPTDPDRGFYHPPEAIYVENKRVPIGKKHTAGQVISIAADPTYDIWAYGVIVYESIAGIPLGPYACRGKRAMTQAEVCKIGVWDENSVRKALKHIPEDDVSHDLLRQLLHHDPEHRISLMRLVLEHPFFTGGNVPSSQDSADMGQPSPKSFTSSSTKTFHSSSSRARPTSGPSQSSGHGFGKSGLKAAGSMDSSENRENNVQKVRNRLSSHTSHTMSTPPSPGGSVRSGRSFGGSFRKLRSSLRRSNETSQA
jgi:ankyrin repeat protein/serine/threonine protein kinase